MDLEFDADLVDGETFDIEHPGTQSIFAVHCKATDVLSKVYSLLNKPCLSPHDYKSLKNEFEERATIIEALFDIENMMAFVDPQVNEDTFSCKFGMDTPFTIINRGQK